MYLTIIFRCFPDTLYFPSFIFVLSFFLPTQIDFSHHFFASSIFVRFFRLLSSHGLRVHRDLTEQTKTMCCILTGFFPVCVLCTSAHLDKQPSVIKWGKGKLCEPGSTMTTSVALFAKRAISRLVHQPVRWQVTARKHSALGQVVLEETNSFYPCQKFML